MYTFNGLLLIANIAFHLTGGKGTYLKKKERALAQGVVLLLSVKGLKLFDFFKT